MTNLCLPTSVGRLCKVLSKLGLRGRYLTHNAAVGSTNLNYLPVSVFSQTVQESASSLQKQKTLTLPNLLQRELQKTWQLDNSNPTPAEVESVVVSPLHHPDSKLFVQSQQGTAHEYICPSRLNISDIIILDKSISQNQILDCPTLPHQFYDISLPELKINKIIDPLPDSSGSTQKSPPAKEARKILKIRRRKMNRHLLLKFRKRMAFTLRKQRLLMKKKKEAIFQAKLDTIKKTGEDFDAVEFIQKELEIARKGGFQISIFSSK